MAGVGDLAATVEVPKIGRENDTGGIKDRLSGYGEIGAHAEQFAGYASDCWFSFAGGHEHADKVGEKPDIRV